MTELSTAETSPSLSLFLLLLKSLSLDEMCSFILSRVSGENYFRKELLSMK